jgi:hypothetical protein
VITEGPESVDDVLLDLDFDGNMDFNFNIEEDLEDLAPEAGTGAIFLETFPRIGATSSPDIFEDTTLHNPSNMAVSPSAEFFDFDEFCSDRGRELTLTVNLPWFQLQTLLEYPGV